MNVILARVEPVTETVTTFWFKPERPFRYLAGQYVEIFLPHDQPDGRGERRWFSLCSSPTEPLLGITVKLSSDGSTFKRALQQLTPGATLSMSEPLGDFVLPKNTSIPLVFVVAGIGITPIRSMVQWLTDKQEQRDIRLIYITRTPEDLLFQPLLETYEGLRLHRMHTSTGVYPTAADIIPHITPRDTALTYLSGPQPLIERLWDELQHHGIDRTQLVLDYFPGYDVL